MYDSVIIVILDHLGYPSGAVAHLGERFNGIEEVGSSSLPSSTIAVSDAQTECYYTDGFVVKWICRFSGSDKLKE